MCLQYLSSVHLAIYIYIHSYNQRYMHDNLQLCILLYISDTVTYKSNHMASFCMVTRPHVKFDSKFTRTIELYGRLRVLRRFI